MAIQIYNTFTKQKEDFVPIHGKTVKMYSCGVTVYDKCHIGHARSLYIFDVICRYLRHRNYDVQFVRNITDVDDKIIKKANELKKTFEEVVEDNIAAYKKDLKNLDVNEADKEPRATENIKGMIEDIQGLIDKGFAYEVDGNVYYNVRQFKEYGKLSKQSVDQMLEATRIDQDTNKKDSLDFALWKNSKEGEPFWDSPWGKGRPGWHIECSCMSLRHLECETLDIHAGGRDLVFPHHENEIAQAEPLHNKPFAKYWIHHGLLTINGQKMAKSSGNFITLDEILERYSNDVLKFFFLQSHYRSPIDFSWEKMEEVKNSYDRIERLLIKLDNEYGTRNVDEVVQGGAGEVLKYKTAFQECLDDDFNTPKALAVIFSFIRNFNKLLVGDEKLKQFISAYAISILKEMFQVLGLNFFERNSKKDVLSSEQKQLLEERVQVRVNKDFQRSDEIRDVLKKQGVIVEDGKDGQTWRRG